MGIFSGFFLIKAKLQESGGFDKNALNENIQAFWKVFYLPETGNENNFLL